MNQTLIIRFAQTTVVIRRDRLVAMIEYGWNKLPAFRAALPLALTRESQTPGLPFARQD